MTIDTSGVRPRSCLSRRGDPRSWRVRLPGRSAASDLRVSARPRRYPDAATPGRPGRPLRFSGDRGFRHTVGATLPASRSACPSRRGCGRSDAPPVRSIDSVAAWVPRRGQAGTLDGDEASENQSGGPFERSSRRSTPLSPPPRSRRCRFPTVCTTISSPPGRSTTPSLPRG